MVVTRKEMMFGIGQLCSITKFLPDFSLEEPDLTDFGESCPTIFLFRLWKNQINFKKRFWEL
jgi:hypothetical protein